MMARWTPYAVVVSAEIGLVVIGVESDSAALGWLLGAFSAILFDPAVIGVGVVLGMIFDRRPLMWLAYGTFCAAVLALYVFNGPAGAFGLAQDFAYTAWALATWISVVSLAIVVVHYFTS